MTRFIREQLKRLTISSNSLILLKMIRKTYLFLNIPYPSPNLLKASTFMSRINELKFEIEIELVEFKFIQKK